MRRNCNLELRLFPFSDNDQSSMVEDYSNQTQRRQAEQQQQQQQQLTIFYDGDICVCDVTELQAKAILLLASKELTTTSPTGTSEPSSPKLPSPVYSPNSGLSMKRSLQRFLQKRNHRIQATYPYNININNRHVTSRVDL